MKDFLEKFEIIIKYHFQNKMLLEQALTHPSISKLEAKKENYERLEFLGDKVLGLIISEFLVKKFKYEKEGDLSKRQASLVSGTTLSKIAKEIKLDEFLQMSKGETRCGGKDNKNNLENCLEALIGAIYLDSNLDNTKQFITTFWQHYLQDSAKPPKDPITKLQEIVQGKTKKLPTYDTKKIGGTDHEPIFTSIVTLPETNQTFEAQGNSKKEAQKNASKLALEGIE
ncbi:MAG: ribonuclease III [Rickettsiales bacterium]|nr:ribonuclease III [Rickettsiales bacterium]